MTTRQRLRSIRESKGLSVRAAARLYGCAHPWIVAIEQGEGDPSPVVIERMAEAYGVTVSYIETGDIPDPSPKRGRDAFNVDDVVYLNTAEYRNQPSVVMGVRAGEVQVHPGIWLGVEFVSRGKVA